MERFLKIYIVEMLLIWAAYAIYYLFPFAEVVYSDSAGFYLNSTLSVVVLFYLAVLYSVVSVPLIFVKIKNNKTTKSWELANALVKRDYSSVSKTNLMFYGVKFFFIPLMLPSAIYYLNISLEMIMYPDIEYKGVVQFFNAYVYSLIVHVVMFIALSIYSFGYLIESEKLNSKIKSVEPTWFGWAVTLICYVPFITVVTRVIPFYTHEFEFFKNAEITFVVRLVLVAIMLLKLWAITTLGARCSNLTNRGITTSGPYKWIRHPHYLTKLLVWWCNFIPLFFTNYWMIGGMIFWTSIYVLRALTEENHLMQEPEYQSYAQKVKWRFIPFIY